MDAMSPSEVIARIRRRDHRYAESAYVFVLAALGRRMEDLERPRHVSGPELADAVRMLALERYGPLARTVLAHWGVQSTSDLGEMVFLLVESGLLTRQPSDSREDFEDLYTFEEAFESDYPWGVFEEGRFA